MWSRRFLAFLELCILVGALTASLVWPSPGPASATAAEAVSAGSYHTCALTSGGGVKCWGRNNDGQLGDGTTTPSRTPVDVVGLSSGVVGISAGFYHTCVLTVGGGAKCWGPNEYGQLGDGTTTSSATPVEVVGFSSGLAAVSAGGEHVCALTVGGGAKCWGRNGWGQLGDGTTMSSAIPVDVADLSSEVAGVSGGGWHTCALTTSGGLKCWGANSNGQLGDGTTTPTATPVDVIGFSSGAAAVSAGGPTCAVTTAGGAKCWGYNEYGQLGDGTTASSAIPVDVVGLSGGVATVSAGGGHTCAVTTAGAVKCWGNNWYGKLGDGASSSSPVPVDVVGLSSGIVAVSAGWMWHTCAVTTGGGAMCWGEGGYGQLGDGTTNLSRTLVDVVGFGPKPVGGSAELPRVSSARTDATGSSGIGGSGVAVMTGATLVGALTLGFAAWYTRRHRAS